MVYIRVSLLLGPCHFICAVLYNCCVINLIWLRKQIRFKYSKRKCGLQLFLNFGWPICLLHGGSFCQSLYPWCATLAALLKRTISSSSTLLPAVIRHMLVTCLQFSPSCKLWGGMKLQGQSRCFTCMRRRCIYLLPPSTASQTGLPRGWVTAS